MAARMSDAEFRELVKQMRSAQQNYFSTRTYEALRKSKELERKVDEEVNPKPTTGNLFEGGQK